MERFDSLKIVIWLIAVVLVIELAMLIIILKPSSFFLWATIIILGILCLYLIRLSLGLVKELKEKSLKKN